MTSQPEPTVVDVLDALRAAIVRGAPVTLATVVNVQGASPARAGFEIVVLSDGGAVGNVGGGPLEDARVRPFFCNGERQLEDVVYPLSTLLVPVFLRPDGDARRSRCIRSARRASALVEVTESRPGGIGQRRTFSTSLGSPSAG